MSDLRRRKGCVQADGVTSQVKKNLKLRAVVSPTPAIVAAAYDENGKADACTLAFYTPTSHKPPCLTIAINATAKRKTLKSILHSGAFTIGYPSIEQAAEADYIGIASGYEHDKYSLEKLKPIIYDDENWRYLAVGEKAADAFKCGLISKKA